MNTLISFLMGLLGGVLALLISTLISPPLSVQSVDLLGLVKPELTYVAQSNQPEAEKIAEIKAFNVTLHTTLRQYARQHHVVLLSKPAIIAGSNGDATAAIAKALQPKIVERRGAP